MLLLMLEAGMPIDCVITADTGMAYMKYITAVPVGAARSSA